MLWEPAMRTVAVVAFVLGLMMSAPFSVRAAGPPTKIELSDVQELMQREAWNDAITKLWTYTESNPDDPDGFNLLGFCYRQDGQFDRAKKAYDRALRLDPDHRGAHEYLGELYLETDQFAKAEDTLGSLYRICGEDCPEYQALAKAIADAKLR
jgi:predicted Zn-dependent protease